MTTTTTTERARALLAEMTLDEKLAQLVGFWVDAGGEVVAPMQGEMDPGGGVAEVSQDGLGQLTRVYGTRPVEPAERARWLARTQAEIRSRSRFGIGALVHEECLTGLAAWQATTFPTPLAWGASFDPDLVEQMGAAIASSMRALGVHQGLAPVLDVVRDARWGRVEECIAEDPYLVGSVGTAYVRGLEGSGVIATLKHFVGYSASTAGRNLAPARVGPRELRDVLLVPFEMAVRDGGVRSVMHSYAEVDGVPVAASAELLTGVLRDEWGFDGVLVADYFGVAFLHTLHQVAADLGEAAGRALAAGVDVELPSGDAFLAPLAAEVRAGRVDEALVDRALLRVLTQKAGLGLLDPADEPAIPDVIDLDPPAHRAIAARLAAESVVLVRNSGVLPLAAGARVAVVGPNADRAQALFGCYSFANHVLSHHPDVPLGIEVRTVLEALRDEADVVAYAAGCAVDDDDRSGIPAAVEAARDADVVVAVVGDQAGLFGRGTVGEGCDRDDLDLPGVQRELVEALLATGTPVVLVLVTGRPYAIGWADGRCAAIVQAFFPGEEGAGAVAGVLSGRVNPSGRLPVTLPRSVGAQPFSYLHPTLGGPTQVSNLDPTPVAELGHGLSYTTFVHERLTVPASIPTAGVFEASVVVTNTGSRAGDDVVQLYARDEFASVTRPVAQLVGYRRVSLEPGESVRVTFRVPTTRLALTDLAMRRVVEPGAVTFWVGPSCSVRETAVASELVGPVHPVTGADERLVTSAVG